MVCVFDRVPEHVRSIGRDEAAIEDIVLGHALDHKDVGMCERVE
jgi:hypothetical protein